MSRKYAPRWAQKPDANHKNITEAIEKAGGVVLDLHLVGQGVPDILVGYRQCLFLLELKTSRGKLNKAQREFHDEWKRRGLPIFTVRSRMEALKAIGAVDG